MSKMKKFGAVLTVALLGVVLGACSDINKQDGPVQLLVTNQQTLHRVDLANGAAGCNQNIATVKLISLPLQGGLSTIPTDNRFNDIQLLSYRVSYARTDGGKTVPEPFVRSISGTLSPGTQGTSLTNFQGFAPDAINQAPFAALLPLNGGRDPETNKPFVSMNIILEVFGQTLAGERVSGSTQIPVDFCVDCGGCA
jgi:hypothetical protein